MAEIEWSSKAENDLNEIIDYFIFPVPIYLL